MGGGAVGAALVAALFEYFRPGSFVPRSQRAKSLFERKGESGENSHLQRFEINLIVAAHRM